MKKLFFVLMLLAVPVSAAPHRFGVAFDVFNSGGIEDGVEKDFKDSETILRNAGVEASQKTETDLGYGVRGTFYFPVQNGFAFGLSGGYIVGPKVTEDLNVPATPSVGINAGTIHQTVDTTFTRFLVEVEKIIPTGNNMDFRLGGGAGLANGSAKGSRNSTGSAALLGIDGSQSDSWSGLTWEVSPSLIFKSSDALDVELGFRYAQFPKRKGSDTDPEIKFTPFSAFLALRFGK